MKYLKKIVCIIVVLFITVCSCESAYLAANISVEESYCSEQESNSDNFMEGMNEFINEHYKSGGEKVEDILSSDTYNYLVEEQQNEDIELFEQSTDIREISCYVQIYVLEDDSVEYEFLTEEEYDATIGDVSQNENMFNECSWYGGRTYTEVDGIMRMNVSSIKITKDKYRMYFNFEWIKNAMNNFFDHYVLFGHDSNMTVDNSSIYFYYCYYRKIIFTGEEKRTILEYTKADKNVVTDVNGIKVKFEPFAGGGIVTTVEKRAGYLKFDASFASSTTNSSQLTFAYYQPYAVLNGFWSDVISMSSSGKISISAGSVGEQYTMSDSFFRK